MKNMERNKGNRTNSENSLDSFSLMEDAIDLSIQEEYFYLSETIDIDNVDKYYTLRSLPQFRCT
jgi:hypothetical protein